MHNIGLRTAVEDTLQQDELSQSHFINGEVVDVVKVSLVLGIFPLVLNADDTTLRLRWLHEEYVVAVLDLQIVARLQ